MVTKRDGGLSTLYKSCGFCCQQKMLKMFLDCGFLLSEGGIIRLEHFLVNMDVYSSLFYLARAQSQYLMVIRMDDGLSTLCHSCGFSCQQRVQKTSPGPGYLHSDVGII